MTLPAEAPRREAGFTLLEMLVVLAVLGLVAGIVLGRGPPRSARLDARAAAAELARALRAARVQAIAGGSAVNVVLDLPGRRYQVDGQPPRALPPGLDLAMDGGPAGRQAGAIGFGPDGSASGGSIRLAAGGVRMQVAVDWFTGRVTVGDAR